MPQKKQQKDRGAALVIVLCMVVLLSTLILAFFSKTVLEHQISNSSSSQVKVDLFGQGAVDQIIGDLKQEIAGGSTVVNITTGSVITPLYRPNVVTGTRLVPGAVPAFAGPGSYSTATWNGRLQNLLKQSASGVPFYPVQNYDNKASRRAAPLSTSAETSRLAAGSGDGTSLNGRSVSAARWNMPLLMEKANPSTTNVTPVTEFKAPDWILISRDGNNPTAWNAKLKWGNNDETVVGRYAYTIYNEGGLLDANVAGRPSTSVMDSTFKKILSRKGSSAFADLTVLPGFTDLGSGRAQQVVDGLVGWRNYASVQPTGSFPDFIFTSGTAQTYVENIMNLSTQFMTPSGTSLTPTAASQSDRIFADRQQLIRFMTSGVAQSSETAAMQKALQYLGTFSRSLNQPAFIREQSVSATQPFYTAGVPKVTNQNSSDKSTVNDAENFDYRFNPAFQAIRVKTAFTRNNLSPAVVGEPLVKKRFALNRLLWLTYKGPSATLPATDPLFQEYVNQGMSATQVDELRAQGTVENIKKYFGLEWTGPTGSRGGYWTYTYGLVTGTTNNIRTLDQVADANREANFFELLEAAINVGSIGKGRKDLSTNEGDGVSGIGNYLANRRDSRIDQQIIAIGANIIDQASPDCFPTAIVFNDGIQAYTYWGKVDLPYFMSMVDMAVVTRAPSPATSGNTFQPVNPPLTITDPGEGAAFSVPFVWNPHNQSQISFPSTLAPSGLRIAVSTLALDQPSASATTNPMPLFVKYKNGTSNVNTPDSPRTAPWSVGTYNTVTGQVDMPTSGTNTALYFPYNRTFYREPTPLWLNSGAGPHVTIDSSNGIVTAGSSSWTSGIPEAGTTNNFVGFFLGKYLLRWNGTDPATSLPATLTANSAQPVHGQVGLTISIEYQAGGSGPWIPYQQYGIRTNFGHFAVPNSVGGTTAYSKSILTTWPSTSNPSDGKGNGDGTNFGWRMNAIFDPRALIWGTAKDMSVPLFSGAGFQPTVTTLRPTAAVGPYRSFNDRVDATTQNLRTTTSESYTDPDTVIRRAMGGYAAAAAAGGPVVGLPMATGNFTSRPLTLNRPFQSVAELGNVFRNMPYRNLDFFSPESGDSALLDLFCIRDDTRTDALAAGKVDLNGRQKDVFKALLVGAYRDEGDPLTNTLDLTAEADPLAQKLINRTTSTTTGQGPMLNLADLVGRYVSGSGTGATYSGFSEDLNSYSGGAGSANNMVQRYRETALRALVDSGQVGTWNLMIDVIVQTGKYPASATGLGQFLVEGERRYWVHVAINRLTGQVIDRQVEVVNE